MTLGSWGGDIEDVIGVRSGVTRRIEFFDDAPAEICVHELSIGKLAKAAGVSIHTVRFYEKSGLLPQPSRRASGFRQYSELELFQLRFVCQARSLGFSIHEIAELLALEGERDSAGVDSVLDSKRELIDRKIAQLSNWRHALDEMRRSSDGHGLTRAFFLQLFGNPMTEGGTELA